MNPTSNTSHTSTNIIFEDAYRRGEVAAPNPATSSTTNLEGSVGMVSASSINNKVKKKKIEDHQMIAEAKKTKLKVFGVTKILSLPKEFDKIELNHLNPQQTSLFY